MIPKAFHRLYRVLFAVGTACPLFISLGNAVAQSSVPYPVRPVSFIVPYAAGGPTDVVARMISAASDGQFGQPVVVMNRPGASGTIGISEVVRSKPDGHVIGYSTAAIMCMQTQVLSLPFSCTGGYQPIVKLFDVPVALAVPADSAIKSLDDFVKIGQAQPGSLRIAVAGRLTEPDLVLEQMKTVAKLDVTTVPFPGGSGPALTAVLGGHVEGFIAAVTQLREFVEGKKLRLLAVFHPTRHSLFPDTPSSVELGYNVTLPAMHFVMGPANMPPDAVASVRNMVRQAMTSARFKELAARSGFAVDPVDEAGLDKDLKSFEAAYVKIAKDLKLEKK